MNFNVTLSLNFANFKKISIHKKTSLSKYKSSYLTLRLLYPRHNTFLAESDNLSPHKCLLYWAVLLHWWVHNQNKDWNGILSPFKSWLVHILNHVLKIRSRAMQNVKKKTFWPEQNDILF